MLGKLTSLDPMILKHAVEDALDMEFSDLREARQVVLMLDVTEGTRFTERLDRTVQVIRNCSEAHARLTLVEDLVAPLLLAVFQATQTCDLGLMAGGD